MAVPPPVTPVKISAGVVRSDYAAYSSGVVLNEYNYDANELPPKVSDTYEAAGGVAAAEARVSENTEKKIDDRTAAIEDVVDEVAASAAAASRPVRTSLQRKDSMEFWLNENQKPPVSSRIGHRKPVRASPEGTSLSLSLCVRHVVLIRIRTMN